MRVLQAMAGADHGGAEAFFLRLVCALHGSGIQQHVLTRGDAERTETLEQAGLRPINLPFGSSIDIITPYVFRREIKRFKPDVVITWMNRATKFCPRGKHVHVARLGGYYNLKYYRDCDYLIGNTEDITNYIKSCGWPKERVRYLPNFVSDKKNNPIAREKLYTPKNAPLIFALGRFHENKAFDVLIKALSRLPEVYCWIAGDGPLRQELEALAQTHGVKPRMRFLGWRDDVASLYAAADLFVCPSRHEPLGNVVIEAWAQKKPVIAADSMGPGTLIENGKNGILFPVDEDISLANAIKWVLSDSAFSEKIAEAGYKSYKENFTMDVVIKKYKSFFEEIIAAEKPWKKGY